MKKILFICYGNICRSPMAEMIMKDLVKKKSMEDKFYIQSAGTSTEEIGSSIYINAQEVLKKNNIPVEDRKARQLQADDYETFDYLVAMEMMNIRDIKSIIEVDSHNKIARLLDYTTDPEDIADPWYSRDFEKTYTEILLGCESFLEYLINNE
jgi:Protein-tyrosine-phosphatase